MVASVDDLFRRGLISQDAAARNGLGDQYAMNDEPRSKFAPQENLADTVRPRPLVGAKTVPAIPKIKLSDESDGSAVHAKPENMQIPEWGKQLSWGMKAFRTERDGQQILQIRDANLPPEMQGQGIGQKMYESMADLAAKEGRALHSDGSVTGAAANRWMELNRSGRNVAMNPDAKYRRGPEEAPELGRFETPDGSPVFRIDPE